eukprot:SAG31_NODE_18562_length_631_cov_1.552632_1_plen_165_part_10
MAALHGEMAQDGRYREWAPFWRSDDGGQSWSERRVLPEWLTATKGGTLFMTSHFLTNDAANTAGTVQAFLHRSTDRGRSWQRAVLQIPADERGGAPVDAVTVPSRNILELAGGALALGVSLQGTGVGYLWRSVDDGATWTHGHAVSISDYGGRPYDNADGFFTED